MIVYWIIIASIMIFGILMPQEGPQRKQYVMLMFVIHAFVCGFKYKYLTGDLMKYDTFHTTTCPKYSLITILTSSWRNVLWFSFNKIVGLITGYNYQVFLVIIAIIIEICVARVIYKFSPAPWLSYLIWNCLGFYHYGFHQLKQSLAMAVLLIAVEGIMENKRIKFYISAIIAGFIHGPAFAFLPMFWLTRRKVRQDTVFIYVLSAALLFLFRRWVVPFMADIYYTEARAASMASFRTGDLGTRFFVICLMLVIGLVIKGVEEERFKRLFLIVSTAALFQMGAIYGNIFTRYADYFLQVSILYLPMLCYEDKEAQSVDNSSGISRLVLFDESARQTLVMGLVFLSLLWYYHFLSQGASIVSVDNFYNFKFFWQVQ